MIAFPPRKVSPGRQFTGKIRPAWVFGASLWNGAFIRRYFSTVIIGLLTFV